MKTYTSKNELKNAIKQSYAKYIAEFDDIAEERKDTAYEGVDRTPAENLA